MAPPDGTRVPRIPALSWDSVVDSDDTTKPPEPAESRVAAVATEPATAQEPVEPVVTAAPAEPITPDAPIEPISLLPLSLDVSAPVAAPTPAPTPSPSPAPVASPAPAAPVAPPAPVAPVAEPVPVAPPASEPLTSPAVPEVTTPTSEEPPSVRTVPPIAIVPAADELPEAPSAEVDALPPIQEATPAPQPSGPLLPSVAAPVVPQPTAVSTFEFDPASVTTPPTRQPVRRKGSGGLKLLVTLVVLGGLVAAGVVFGQPYLFPNDWDDATAPYAEAVESAGGVDFVVPLTITALPSAEFADRLTAELAPATPQQVAEWRALGLASGPVDDATITAQLTGWRDVVYTADDGQVYHDAGVASGPGLDAELVQAMAAASLDQQYSWSSDQTQRSVDANVAVSAEVLRQVQVIQRSSDFAAATAPVPAAQLDGLPAFVDYQLLAPHVFAEFATDAADEPNPLDELSSSSGAAADDSDSPRPSLPVLADGDVMTDSPVVQDRSFWYLVFAGLLDGPTAFSASEAIVENSLVHATRGATECVYATFSGGGVDETAMLRSTLASWSERAPAEFASSFTTLPDGSLQLSSCDPGAEFAAPLRTTAVDELIAYRSLELATAAAVAEQGGGDPEFAYVWNLITTSTMPNDVATLSAGSPPGQIATVASDAVAALYDLAG